MDRIIEGDCLIEMQRFPDKYFDLCLTDPPYGIGEAAGKNQSRNAITVFGKKKATRNADCELAWTSFQTSVRKFKFRWNGMQQEDMKHKEKRYHPTQKPVKLFMQIIEKYSQSDDKILDPFLGSGTTMIAAQKTGRHCIGIEREAAYCDIARKRLSALPARLDAWLQ
jgi:site-specific DNA-methyltransferase (adenine-specific)